MSKQSKWIKLIGLAAMVALLLATVQVAFAVSGAGFTTINASRSWQSLENGNPV
jgi:hypothetical protein